MPIGTADGCLIVTTGADRLLGDEPADREVLFRVLRTSAGHWARAGTPFNVVLVCPPSAAEALAAETAF